MILTAIRLQHQFQLYIQKDNKLGIQFSETDHWKQVTQTTETWDCVCL